MQLTSHEIWTALHGMAFGAAFLLLFSGVFIALWCMRSDWLTDNAALRLGRHLCVACWSMAILSWLAVIIGTYVVYPWYRVKAPEYAIGGSILAQYPKAMLLSKPETADWHEFGMEWKEHIAWLVPILSTAVAYVVTRHRRQLLTSTSLRRAMLILVSIAFFCASIAGIFGAMINKAAPTR